MCHHLLWWVRRFFSVPSFRIPLIWFLYFLLTPPAHCTSKFTNQIFTDCFKNRKIYVSLNGCDVTPRSFSRFGCQEISVSITVVYFSDRAKCTRVGTLMVATIYLQLIQNRYMFRSFTVLQCSHQHCVQPIASDVEVAGYL